MKAVAIKEGLPTTDDSVFVELEMDTPTPGPKDLLIKVEAVSVNPVDYKVRQGHKAENGVRVLGWDGCGEVVAIGKETENFSVGDRVYYAGDLTRAGSNSEYQLVDYRIVGIAPNNLSSAEAAALPLTAITAWEGIFDRLGIQRDQSGKILIIGGAGGVGSIAIQLLQLTTNMQIITTASRPQSKEHCLNLGAHIVVDWKELTHDLHAEGIEEVDFILNCNDMDQYWSAMVELICPQGKICSIVENNSPLEMNTLKLKSATLVWEFMFTRAMYTTPDIAEQGKLLNEISQMIVEGKIKTTLSKVLNGLSTENMREVHTQLESGKTVGKWVIQY